MKQCVGKHRPKFWASWKFCRKLKAEGGHEAHWSRVFQAYVCGPCDMQWEENGRAWGSYRERLDAGYKRDGAA